MMNTRYGKGRERHNVPRLAQELNKVSKCRNIRLDSLVYLATQGFATFSSMTLADDHPEPLNADLFGARFRAWMLEQHKHSDELRGILRARQSHPVTPVIAR